MRLVFLSAAFGLALAGGALASDPLVIEADQSTMLSLPSTPGAVVIGNPTIADATVQGDKLLVHGRAFGTTNIIILDQDGKQSMNVEVSVRHEVQNLVAVFKADASGASRRTYSCAPLCQSELQIGDDVVYNGVLVEQIKNKIKLATGQEDSKSEAPPAPQ
ncbi:MAG: pilus assembly protein N-terminal domain-containing protein [Proteobacteria bacterium]|nr:pilus assembly protein N-terminal domain-containing protein [Pseudomonadota bacterium]